MDAHECIIRVRALHLNFETYRRCNSSRCYIRASRRTEKALGLIGGVDCCCCLPCDVHNDGQHAREPGFTPNPDVGETREVRNETSHVRM